MNTIDNVTESMKKILGIKSTKWNYEDEYRIISSKSGVIKYNYRAVKSIYFGLKMEEKQKDDIMKKLQGRGIQYHQVKLKNNSYEFYDMPMDDLYKTDKKYLYSIAPIQDYAMPFSLTKKSNKYKLYCQKVAEIVRREPYCNSVEYVGIDEEKSKAGKIIFLVQFLKDGSKKINQYYTLKEIDTLYSKIDDL